MNGNLLNGVVYRREHFIDKNLDWFRIQNIECNVVDSK